MNFTLGIFGIFLAVLIGYLFLHIQRKRLERIETSDLDIPAFLRRDGASDNITDNIKIHPDIVNIHPWGKTE